MIRSKPIVFHLQKAWDDAQLVATTAIFFESRNNEVEALRAWRNALEQIRYHNAYRMPSNYRPKTDADRSLIESLKRLEIQCSERVELLETLQKSRMEAGTNDASVRQDHTEDQKGWLGEGTIPPLDYTDLTKLECSPGPSQRLEERPFSRNNSDDTTQLSGGSCSKESYKTTQSRQNSIPEQKFKMRRTLRPNSKSRTPSSTSVTSIGTEARPPEATKAANQAWDSINKRSDDNSGVYSGRKDAVRGSTAALSALSLSNTAIDSPTKLSFEQRVHSTDTPLQFERYRRRMGRDYEKEEEEDEEEEKREYDEIDDGNGGKHVKRRKNETRIRRRASSPGIGDPTSVPGIFGGSKYNPQDLKGEKASSRIDSQSRGLSAARPIQHQSPKRDNAKVLMGSRQTLIPSITGKSLSTSTNHPLPDGNHSILHGLIELDQQNEFDAQNDSSSTVSNHPPGHLFHTQNERTWRSKVDTVLKELPRGVDPNSASQILNEIVIHGDRVHWDDIAGLEVAKKALKEAVVYPFLRPDLFVGLREPARGMLLFGPPGTGKTMLARAVATESKSTFFAISASSLTSKYLGDSEKLVRALFALAKVLAPSIIFVDEIDSLLSTRNDSTEHEASRRIKTEFLIQWSSLAKASAGREEDRADSTRVLVLAATNAPWLIDEAARRRFARRQYIPLPEPHVRLLQLKGLLSHQKQDLTDDDIDNLVERTKGFSGSDITALAKDAAMGPLRSLGEELLNMTMDDIRPIKLEDFIISLGSIRPSVDRVGLEKFEDWAKDFGERGG